MHENTRLAVMEDIKKLANTKFELLPSFFQRIWNSNNLSLALWHKNLTSSHKSITTWDKLTNNVLFPLPAVTQELIDQFTSFFTCDTKTGWPAHAALPHGACSSSPGQFILWFFLFIIIFYYLFHNATNSSSCITILTDTLKFENIWRWAKRELTVELTTSLCFIVMLRLSDSFLKNKRI